jgi:carbon-monoxide dehydrogenase iron sulfur subunit
VAVKCDNCVDRQKEGRVPACVETCLVGALEFGDPNELLREETRQLARQMSLGIREATVKDAPTEAVALWRALGDAAAEVAPE